MLAYLEIALLGGTLALDACVVAFSYGLCVKPWRLVHGLKIAFITSLFQYIMPVLGWYVMWLAKGGFTDYASLIDHWITFIIFAFLGSKIIKDAILHNKDEQQNFTPLSLWLLFMIGIATSIDALAAGVMIFSQHNLLWQSAFLIAAITFISVFMAYISSRFLKTLPTRYLEIAAGVVLIALGLKVLFEHIFASSL